MFRLRRIRFAAFGFSLTAALSLCGCAPSPSPAASAHASSAPAKLELIGGDFPELVVDEAQKTTDAVRKPGADPCKTIHAKTIPELDPHWAAAIVITQFSCNDEEDGPHMIATAKLLEGAATMFGVPAIEVKRERSGRAISDSYVLAGSLDQDAQALTAGIEARCRARHPEARCTAEREQGNDNSVAYVRYRIELGGSFYQWSQRSDTPQRIVYMESMETF